MESETKKLTAVEGKGFAARAPIPLNAAARSLDIGDTAGRYLIISRLYEGDTSIIYAAHDTELDRTVAIKTSPSLKPGREALELLRRQAKVIARINSPHVVTLYEMIDLANDPALVMEYLVGQTLAQKLRNQTRLGLQEAGRVFGQALDGIERIHRLGIVHGDLRPDNIFITTDHLVKLLGFRLAMYLDKVRAPDPAPPGNLLYAAPEQRNGKPADFRSDLYTLGITLHEAVTGSLPFEADPQRSPPEPGNGKPGREIPAPIAAMLQKATQKDPGKRFQSVREFRDAWLEALASAPASDNRATKTGASSSPRAASTALKRTWLRSIKIDLALIAMIAAFIVVLGLFPNKEKTKPETPAAGAQKKDIVQDARRANSNNPNPPQDRYKELRKAWE